MTTRVDVRNFLRRHRVGVQASVSSAGASQAAVVVYAVTDELELVFETTVGSRKMQNLRHDPRGYPAKGVNVWLGLPFRAAHTELPAHVVFNRVNDPHYWLAEYMCTQHDHVLACPFPRAPGGAGRLDGP